MSRKAEREEPIESIIVSSVSQLPLSTLRRGQHESIGQEGTAWSCLFLMLIG